MSAFVDMKKKLGYILEIEEKNFVLLFSEQGDVPIERPNC
jgi:hypothetical protein